MFCEDLLQELGINLNFSVGWKETKILMKSINCKKRTKFVIQDSNHVQNATDRIKMIFDAKYK